MLARAPRLLLLLVLGLTVRCPAAEKPGIWLEVRSPHFTVITNAHEKQGRRVAERFERIRAAFRTALPRLQVDAWMPITVFAVKDEKSFGALGRDTWRGRRQMRRTGFFLTTAERNYVVLRLDVPEDDPNRLVFHEYAHLLLHQSAGLVPLWLDEGIAEFFGYSEIHEKEVWLGRPSADHILLLRQARVLPLKTLFAVDSSSPYYNEENKGTIFYAESWALVHYLMVVVSHEENKPVLSAYLASLKDNPDSVGAARRVFGDLDTLQGNVANYIQRSSFGYWKIKGSAEVEDESLEVRELSPAEVDMARGDLLVHQQRLAEGRALLEEAIRENPRLAPAYESLGYLELRQQRPAKARRYYARAVELDSHSYLAQYNYAVMTMGGPLVAATSGQVEKSLRTAIQINPRFAPAYDALAGLYGMRGEKLEEAHGLALQAVQLEPGNIRYRVNVGLILLRLGRAEEALRVGEHTLEIARSAEDRAAAQSFLETTQKMREVIAARKQAEEERRAAMQDRAQETPGTAASGSAGVAPPSAAGRPETPEEPPLPPKLVHKSGGKREVALGTVAEVTCTRPAAMDLTLQDHGKTIKLHSENYFRINFSTLRWKPPEPFNLCKDLKGLRARVRYEPVQDASYAGEIVSVELDHN